MSLQGRQAIIKVIKIRNGSTLKFCKLPQIWPNLGAWNPYQWQVLQSRIFKFLCTGVQCNSFFFVLSLAPLLSLPISWHPILPWGCQNYRKRKQRSQNESGKERFILNCRPQKCLKSRTFRPATGLVSGSMVATAFLGPFRLWVLTCLTVSPDLAHPWV